LWSLRNRHWARLGRPGLAGQILLLQVLVLGAALAVASVVAFRQAADDFRDTRGTRLLAAAEHLANTGVVRDALAAHAANGRPLSSSLSVPVTDTQVRSATSSAYLAAADGEILAAAPDPLAVGERLDLADSSVRALRVWTGDADDRGAPTLMAHVPVIGDDASLVGIVAVGERIPGTTTVVRAALPDLVAFLGTGLGLGLVGAWALARLVKRRTRGLEPREIAALADQREAVLHSIREGVLVVSQDGADAGRVTVANDSACALLGLPADVVGRHVGELDLLPGLRSVLADTRSAADAVVTAGDRLLVLNREPVRHAGRVVGTVTTLRDRTELVAARGELDTTRSITETLRAQTHEFANQLHTISGLLQLGDTEEAQRFLGDLSRRRAELTDAVVSRIEDRSVAALLVAKASLAGERDVRLELAEDAHLPALPPGVSADVGTILGNLVDNALDATADARGPRVLVDATVAGDRLTVTVADCGGGVPPTVTERIFERGWSTKPSDATGRGVGLALVQLLCRRHGGAVTVRNAPLDGHPGAVFAAELRWDSWSAPDPVVSPCAADAPSEVVR